MCVLLALPFLLQVEKIHIDYAKTAKKFDVKKLKTRMWDFISHPHSDGDARGKAPENGGNGDENTVRCWVETLDLL